LSRKVIARARKSGAGDLHPSIGLRVVSIDVHGRTRELLLTTIYPRSGNQFSMSFQGLSMRRFAALVVIGSCAVAGCADDGIGKRYPVSGTVTYKGEPVEKAKISFVPKDPNGRGATGTVENGSYTLTTVDTNDGALAGEYRVTVDAREIDEAQAKSMTDERVRREGGDPSTMTMVPQDIQAQLLSQSKSSIPGKYQIPDTSDWNAVVEEKSNTIDFDLTD
jgi:hypothetical protein